MERRILFAFILSFIVLSAWSSLFAPPKGKMSNNLQNIGDNKVIEEVEETAVPSQVSEVAQNVQTETKILENTKLVAEFSNLGGNLVKVTMKNYNVTLPVADIFGLLNFSDRDFELVSESQDRISYVYEAPNGKIYKRYTLSSDDYRIRAEIEFQGVSPEDIGFGALLVDIGRLDNKNVADPSLFEYFILSSNISHRKAGATKFSRKEERIYAEEIELLGFRDRYFCMILKPDFKVNRASIDYIDEDTLGLRIYSGGERGRIYGAEIYFGPQELDILKQYKLRFERAMTFSDWGWLDALAKGIYGIMHWLHSKIPNWGVCILLISFIIYGAMYPLTLHGMASMKRMQSVQPMMNKLREQHKNNPQRLNKEIMELYKEHRVNPLGGCLPLVLQMPVFVALYQVLWRSVAFKGADFLWIKDLSQPDRFYLFPFSLPFIGNELNILPLLMMGIMFVQQKLSAKNMVIVDPAQEAQQKMMAVVFPVMLGFIFYKFASGLSLYFTTFYLMSTLTQWKMSRMKAT